ncbi:hypothetical protein [Mycolicibacterium hodleri]|uniref:DUF385 domain-containing protein n=1 Tax=Mycolicibacterium hodleri TaxID=49897 RepID=A0A502ECF8_9MYCO|nr:hypothetical protein [Mycolicibacterium hodleri]TPG34176.1 hypothetical protein EAH80_11235 [Mycolicibacterium hodleri]
MPTIDTAHPPQLMLRVVNPALRTALRIPGLGSALKDFMVVEYTGRKSGRRFSVPVSAHHLDGDLYVILEAGWKHNFADGAPADVWFGGKKTPMQGQLIKDPATAAAIAHRVATEYGPKKAQRSMGLRFTGSTVPSLDEFTEAAGRTHLAAIKLTPRS